MQNVIDILQARGFIDAITSENLGKILEKPATVYAGFDPTADSLHLGNLVAIMGLSWFQRCGHKPVAIVGGATALIGDPSGKSHERPLLSEEAVQENLKGIRKNLEVILGKEATILNNYDWFKEFSFIAFLRDIGKQFRMGPMLAKDSVKSRLQSEEGMSFTEFCYQLLQGYDFYHLYSKHQVTVQLGGSDQWGNITAGIDLIRKMTGGASYGVTFSLLTRSDGKKFGKSESGAIWLSPDKLSSYDLYQYLVRIPDADVIRLLKVLTYVDLGEIRHLEREMQGSEYVANTVQKKLAEEVTRLLHGEEALSTALKVTSAVQPGSEMTLDYETIKQIARDMPSVSATKDEVVGQKLIDVAANLKIVASKGDLRRLIRSGAVTLNNEKIQDENFTIQSHHPIENEYLLLALGKKNKLLIKIVKSA